MLHLDIMQPGVRSVEDALDVLTAGEQLSGELTAHVQGWLVAAAGSLLAI